MTDFFSNIILSILGLVVIGVFVDLLVPNGKMQNVVKTVLAIFTTLIILKPIINFDFKAINFDELSSSFNYVDNSYVNKFEDSKIEKLKDDILNNLSELGYKNVLLEFNSDKNNNIIRVYVDLSRLVLIDEGLNINKYTNIIAVVKQFVKIDKDNIIFYE